jgi:hypothetical protein
MPSVVYTKTTDEKVSPFSKTEFNYDVVGGMAPIAVCTHLRRAMGMPMGVALKGGIVAGFFWAGAVRYGYKYKGVETFACVEGPLHTTPVATLKEWNM